MSSYPLLSDPSRPQRRRRQRLSLMATGVALALAGCGGPARSEPPVVMLDEPVEPPPVRAEAAPVEPAVVPLQADRPDVCGLVDDANLVLDVDAWESSIPELESILPPGIDVRGVLADVAGDAQATPTRLTRMDAMWDGLDEHCGVEPERQRCRDLVMVALADPLGWGSIGEDPVEVEAAFDLALANLTDLRAVAQDEGLQHALDAQIRFTAGARDAFARAGWGPDGFAEMEDIQADIVVLGSAEVTGPLFALESQCGLHGAS